MQLVLDQKKKEKKPKWNMRKLWAVHQERKERENPTHKKYGHLAPSVPNNKGMSFSEILHHHNFKYTILNVFTEPAMH